MSFVDELKSDVNTIFDREEVGQEDLVRELYGHLQMCMDAFELISESPVSHKDDKELVNVYIKKLRILGVTNTDGE